MFLVLTGAFEIGFTTAMKLDGTWATVLFVFAALSFWRVPVIVLSRVIRATRQTRTV